ncbi:hypothetical protein BKA83DRAFT_4127278 [Pisolithus microcarpus]|nr:hypothetical protein BKA83DRAFT_4127278 [Pisolithus microcarpus]
MPKAKQKLCQSQKISHCPDCGKRFASKTRVLQHMNQPSNMCGSWMDHFSSYLCHNASTTTWNGTETHHPTELQHQAGANCNGDLEEDIADYGLASDGFGLGAVEDTASHAVRGTTFMDWFFDDQYATLWWQNLYYPFASAGDWQLASWLLCSWLSMATIDDFLSLQLVHLAILLFGYFLLNATHPSHPLFTSHISFIPWRVWSSSVWIVRIYEEWMSGNHAWSLQDQIPNGAMLLGVILSSDKTNILVMTGNRMAHPLLLSLTNIDADIRSKGSLHGHVLLALLPVVSFIHGKTHICSLLSDRLIHESLDFVLKPLKVAVAIGVMMSDPVGNLCYCFTPLIAYIADTPEQSLLACISPKASPVSTAVYKEFGDPFPHPPRTAGRTLDNIEWACIEADPNDFEEFLKAAKRYSLSGVHKPFCIVLRPAEIDYRFSLIQTPVRYCSFGEGVSKLKQVTGRDHRAMQSEKCFRFDLATCLASAEQGELGEDDEDQEDEHEPDFEALHVTHYYTPSHTSVNYFESAKALASGAVPNAILSHRIFVSSTTTFHLAFKPSLHVTIDEAAETFGLSDLRLAITDYVHCDDRLMTEVLNPSTKKVQIWFKVRVQQPSYHD